MAVSHTVSKINTFLHFTQKFKWLSNHFWQKVADNSTHTLRVKNFVEITLSCTYIFCYLATNEKIAITHLLYAMELQTMYHLMAKVKIAEQHLLGKYSNCNNFGVTKALLNSKNSTVAITQLFNVQQV